jgi:ADP-ribose pyrophosphatase YjhB (NUDIX family)
VDPRLQAFLAGRRPFAAETATWDTLDLKVRYYASAEAPPEHLVTSVRAVVLTPAHVLTIREPTGAEHIIPGGRLGIGESFEEALRREVLEETCWTVTDLTLLAVVHFHITSPVPEEYPYPHPDFLQLVYLTNPDEFHADREIEDEWVVRCEMLPIRSLDRRPISRPQRLLLAQAIERLGACT